MAQGVAGRSASNPAQSGYGCAAASVSSGVIILDGCETSDLSLENGETRDEWKNSHLEGSLCAIFAAQAAATRRENKTMLMLCVNSLDISSNQQQAVIRTANELFTEVITSRLLQNLFIMMGEGSRYFIHCFSWSCG
jgi:hypothetical protein